MINASISLDPSTISNTDFTDMTANYDEFRVLGARLKLVSVAPNSTTNTNGFVAIVFDNDSNSSLSSFTGAQQYNTCKLIPAIFLGVQKMTWYRPTSGSETTIPWIDVNTSSSSAGGILFYATGLTASTAYLSYCVELLIEFRGRR